MSLSLPNFGLRTVGIISVCTLLVLGMLIPAYAKDEPEESVIEPADPGLTVPRLIVPEYRSPLTGFQHFEDADHQDWKEANDRVGEIGGWRVYSREAFESDDMDKDSK
jgi:hypothetical protein